MRWEVRSLVPDPKTQRSCHTLYDPRGKAPSWDLPPQSSRAIPLQMNPKESTQQMMTPQWGDKMPGIDFKMPPKPEVAILVAMEITRLKPFQCRPGRVPPCQCPSKPVREAVFLQKGSGYVRGQKSLKYGSSPGYVGLRGSNMLGHLFIFVPSNRSQAFPI